MRLCHAHRAFIALALCLSAAPAVQAQSDYPSRPIRVLVGFAAGGPVDVTARIVADALTAELGRTVVVDNRPGAGGNVAADQVAKSPPDGYTLLQSSNALAISPGIYSKLPFDVLKDFTPVSEVTTTFLVLVVHPSVAAKTLSDFIAYGKAKAGLDYGSAGAGTITHLAAVLFARETGLTLQHVPYRGSAPAVTDLVAGRVLFMFAPIGTAKPFIEAGKLRAIAVSGPRRVEGLPGVPTVDEAGVRGFEASGWNGLFAPAGTPKPVVDRLHRAVVNILKGEETRRRLAQQDAIPRGTDPDAFRRYVAADVARWIEVAKASGIKGE